VSVSNANTPAASETVRQFILVHEEPMPIDTDEQIAAAQQALRDVGEEVAAVYVGPPDCPDSYKGSMLLFASD
jgi:hypothetical protein